MLWRRQVAGDSTVRWPRAWELRGRAERRAGLGVSGMCAAVAGLYFCCHGLLSLAEETPARLPGTGAWQHPETSVEEMADLMVAGADRFLLAETERSLKTRSTFWQRDFSSPEAYEKSITPNRDRLKWLLGLREERIPFDSPHLQAELQHTAERGFLLDAAGEKTHRILAISWPVAGRLHWEGLLIEPLQVDQQEILVTHILLPNAGQEPESLVMPGAVATSPVVALARERSRVIIPATISRTVRQRRRAELTDREFVYRTAFIMGRTPIGYEIQATLGLLDWLKREAPERPVGLVGNGEGGAAALFCAALDPRIDAVCVSGYFGSQQNLWERPIDRNWFGYLERFGDAEVATLIAPRPVIIEPARQEPITLATSLGAPGTLVAPTPDDAQAEADRARELWREANTEWPLMVTAPPPKQFPRLAPKTLQAYLDKLPGLEKTLRQPPVGQPMIRSAYQGKLPPGEASDAAQATTDRELPRLREWHMQQAEARQLRLVDALTEYNRDLLEASPEVRTTFMEKLDLSSLERFEETVEWYRDYFRHEVIGHFDQPLLEPAPRSRLWRETEHWNGYEVQLDVFPDVFAYGVLLLPKDLRPEEQRPVVVLQHGLEGTPLGTIEGAHRAYHDFAARLADMGYIVFAPQNPYRGQDRFRTLQRKANPLGKTLFSIIVPQHEQITSWLGSLPQVDENRIAFYGLSYGGKTAMRVPPLVSNYCLSICSADFNDWVRKNVSTTARYSYVWTGEYEIFEFDLGNTFNYAEMAALIAPRPFMVERGHFDGVAPDEWVASEFAKVRFLYQAKLGLKDHAVIEYFVGPHAINGVGTVEFLNRHLDFTPPRGE